MELQERIPLAWERGRDVHNKYRFSLLGVMLALGLTGNRAMGQMSKASDLDIPASFVGGSLTCSQPPETPPAIRVPAPLVQRARLKARLAILLRDSLYDDAKGIVNIARENEIRKLANKLRNQHD
jgi:hypothetical protein